MIIIIVIIIDFILLYIFTIKRDIPFETMVDGDYNFSGTGKYQKLVLHCDSDSDCLEYSKKYKCTDNHCVKIKPIINDCDLSKGLHSVTIKTHYGLNEYLCIIIINN